MNARDEIRQRNYQMCLDHGMTVTRQGQAWRVAGRDVAIIVSDLVWLKAEDLLPDYAPLSKSKQARR